MANFCRSARLENWTNYNYFIYIISNSHSVFAHWLLFGSLHFHLICFINDCRIIKLSWITTLYEMKTKLTMTIAISIWFFWWIDVKMEVHSEKFYCFVLHIHELQHISFSFSLFLPALSGMESTKSETPHRTRIFGKNQIANKVFNSPFVLRSILYAFASLNWIKWYTISARVIWNRCEIEEMHVQDNKTQADINVLFASFHTMFIDNLLGPKQRD